MNSRPCVPETRVERAGSCYGEAVRRGGLMDRLDRAAEELLLDLHLDRVTEEQKRWLREELDRDEGLALRNQRLTRVLTPLDLWTVAGPPNDISERVLGFVRSESLNATPAPVERRARVPWGGSWFRFREVLAAAACVGLLVGVIIPGMSSVRDRSRRAMCAGNLSSLFAATSTYQETFAGVIPYAGFVPDSSWLVGGAADRTYASNSRHLYRLVSGSFGAKPSNFICPAEEGATPMAADEVQQNDDFASACNVSYASLNLAAASPNLRPNPRVAYLSDRNPLFERARFKTGVDPDTTNSPIHHGRGQSVLLLDGSVRWLTTPVYGPNNDNLWLVGDIRTYTGCEAPTREDDAQLIPGFPARECGQPGESKH